LARGIHSSSERSDGPFVVVDCGAIPESLVESELFGHEKGAFTGAHEARRGLFEEAHEGTIFLDEIGELPLSLQPKLLRALEQREVRPVGARAPRSIDVRVVAATNRRLAEAARAQEFRHDLYYRLAVMRVIVPPLRDRPEDIVPLATDFLRRFKHDPNAGISPDFAALLTGYDWPGNVRELRNVVERYAIVGEAGEDLLDVGGDAIQQDLSRLPYHEARGIVVDRFDREYVGRILERSKGVVTRAADEAELGRATLYRMMDRLGMSRRDDG
jgi:transcriptional regulator with PAS, ATPase and Fis domain